MASTTWWPWVWPSSGSWWWTGKPGVLQSMGVTKGPTQLSNWTELIVALQCCVNFCGTAKWVIYMYAYIPSLLDVPPTLHSSYPIIYDITEHRAELPVVHSWFPLAIYFTYGSVYMSIPISKLSHPPTLLPIYVFLSDLTWGGDQGCRIEWTSPSLAPFLFQRKHVPGQGQTLEPSFHTLYLDTQDICWKSSTNIVSVLYSEAPLPFYKESCLLLFEVFCLLICCCCCYAQSTCLISSAQKCP